MMMTVLTATIIIVPMPATREVPLFTPGTDDFATDVKIIFDRKECPLSLIHLQENFRHH
jgi:hypothetical protein